MISTDGVADEDDPPVPGSLHEVARVEPGKIAAVGLPSPFEVAVVFAAVLPAVEAWVEERTSLGVSFKGDIVVGDPSAGGKIASVRFGSKKSDGWEVRRYLREY